MNFFGANCQSGPFTYIQFGICDDQPGAPSYVDTANANKWIATVENNAQTPVTFTAIDKCVIQDGGLTPFARTLLTFSTSGRYDRLNLVDY